MSRHVKLSELTECFRNWKR